MLTNCMLCGGIGSLLYKNLTDRMYGAIGAWNLLRCPSDGLVWIDPLPDDAELRAAYETYYTHPKTLSRLGRIKHRLTQDRLLHIPASFHGATLIDVGCGNGASLDTFRSFGWSAVGIDTDHTAVEYAKAQGRDVRAGTLAEQRFTDHSIDAITSIHSLEHFRDPEAFLKECRRVLKLNGFLLVVTPNIDSLLHQRMRSAWLPLDPPRHIFLFSPHTLTTLLRRAGFVIDSLKTTSRGSRALWWRSRRVARYGTSQMKNPASLLESTGGKAFQLFEDVWLRRCPLAGEELSAYAVPAP